MYLKRIELRGFKSFAGSKDVELSPGITGVVGPNGSGKSNIVDALRWVLGEQSSRNLRGSNMQDVIFKGTQTRPSRNSCQVSLIFDNSDGRLHSDYSEVCVSRMVSRAGESEYRLNGTVVRLKDVVALFRDTGIGKDGYSIVGQGRINQILEDRASERRNVFEEAAGVMKYRVAKEEAERNLDKARANTERVRDILTELNAQAGPAKEEMERAKAYLTLSDELKRLEIGAILWDYDQAAARQKTAEEKLSDIAGREKEHNEAVEQAKAQGGQAREEMERVQQALSAASTAAAQYAQAAEKEKGACALQRQRISDAQERIEKAREAIAEKDLSSAQAAEQLGKVLESASATRAQAEEEKSQIAPLLAQIEQESATDQGVQESEELESSEELRVRASNELARAKALEMEISNLLLRRDAMLTDTSQSASAAKEAKNAFDAAQADFAHKQARFAELSQQLVAMQQAGDEREQTISNLRARANGLLDAHSRAHSQWEAIRSVLDQHQGYYDSVRSLMRDASRDPALQSHLIGVVGDCISVQKEHETAVEIALGAGVQNVIVPTDEDAKALVAHLRERRYGRVTFLPSNALRISRLGGQERSVLREEGVLCVASDAVTCEPNVRPAVEYLLARTVIVRDLDTALRLKRQNKNTFRIVTSSGEVVSPGGAITGGDAKRSQKGFLSRQREAEDARARAGQLQKQYEDALSSLKDTEATQEQERSRMRHVMGEHAAARSEAQSAQMELERLRARLAETEQAAGRRKQETEGLDTQEASLRQSLAEASGEAERLEELYKTVLAREQQAESDRTQQALQAASIRTRIAEMEAQASQTASQAEMLEADARHLEEAIRRQGQEKQDLEQEVLALESVVAEARRELDAAKLRLDAATRSGQEAADSALQHQSELSRLEELTGLSAGAMAELEKAGRAIFEERISASSERERARDAQRELLERLWSEYELTLGNAYSYRNEAASRRKAGARIGEIRDEIRSLGVVNPKAPEDYAELSARLTELTAQEEDLVKAEEDLRTVIGELLKGMREIFTQKFAQINENFQRTFEALFGGGTARLELEEGVDAMQAGIEIKAEPPGKKLQSLALLSGGERALTAVALIFAMLDVNPSPVCLLDEIDAPLDDKNVTRLSDYLKKLSERLQFIVITHKKTTMAVCDALYGISMPEKGVSEIVSVQLKEGDKHGLFRED